MLREEHKIMTTENDASQNAMSEHVAATIIGLRQRFLTVFIVQAAALFFADFVFGDGESGEFLENGYVLIAIIVAFLALAIYYVVLAVKLSVLLGNSMALTVLLGVLTFVLLTNLIPLVVLLIQAHKRLKRVS
jgi:hypothetical protein